MDCDVFQLLTAEEYSKLQAILDPDDEIESVSLVFKTRGYYYVKKSKKTVLDSKQNPLL